MFPNGLNGFFVIGVDGKVKGLAGSGGSVNMAVVMTRVVLGV